LVLNMYLNTYLNIYLNKYIFQHGILATDYTNEHE